jgi:hypothetical protein
MGSLVDWDDPITTAPGLANVAKNVRYLANSVATRYGIKSTIQVTAAKTVRGMAMTKTINAGVETEVPIFFDSGGNLLKENPSGSGIPVPINGALVNPPQNAFMNTANAYNRDYLAWSDLKNGLIKPSVYNALTNALEPLSMKPVGDIWRANTVYRVGEMVCPAGGNGHWYRCTVAGTSGGAQPAFPGGVGATVADNGITWTEATPTFTNTGVGNICAGIRYAIVLFVNNNDCISGFGDVAPLVCNIGVAGVQLQTNVIPIGPANTKKRIVCFTVVGDTAQGNFKYIDQTEVVAGFTMTTTVIPDNVTTAATFNFTDDFLKNAVDVSGFFDKIEVPETLDIFFSPTLNRMVYTGCKNFESNHLFSLQQDPESVFATTGNLPVAENNGERCIALREMLTNIYSLKEESGHIVTASGEDPSGWAANELWSGMGPAGPRAVAVKSGGEDGQQFMIFAHRSGAYRFTGAGGPIWISKEIQKTWKRINWTVKHLIWVHIDEENKEVRFGVPIDGSAVPNKVLTLNYANGWDSMTLLYRGVPLQGRKWSLDDISAYGAITARRTLAVGITNEINNRQVLFASATDNNVNMIVPGQYNDNGAGIDSQYQPAYVSYGGTVMQYGGFNGSAVGNGNICFTALTDSSYLDTSDTRFVSLDANNNTYFEEVVTGTGEVFGVLITNDRDNNGNAVADSYFELHELTLWARPFAQPRSRFA